MAERALRWHTTAPCAKDAILEALLSVATLVNAVKTVVKAFSFSPVFSSGERPQPQRRHATSAAATATAAADTLAATVVDLRIANAAENAPCDA